MVSYGDPSCGVQRPFGSVVDVAVFDLDNLDTLGVLVSGAAKDLLD